MFTSYSPGNVFQRAVCMFFAVVIVGGTLSLGAVAAQSAVAAEGYSVTITQLA